MRGNTLWEGVLGLNGAVVERVEVGEAMVRIVVTQRACCWGRCVVCGDRCKGYDKTASRRVWRALDVGIAKLVVEMDGHRVFCPTHGVALESVSWARRGSAFTRRFEDHVAWMCARTNQSAVGELFRVTWSTVRRIVERVVDEARSKRSDASPRHIGIDEVSYRRGHRYVTVVVDHANGDLLYAAEGKGQQVIEAYFETLGPERCAQIELCSMDAAPQYKAAVAKWCPNARICMDPFHVVQWMTRAVDEVRRAIWRKERDGEGGSAIKSTRWILLTGKEHLKAPQQDVLERLQRENKPLYKVWLLKEQLREVFKVKGDVGCSMLDAWVTATKNCGIKAAQNVADSVSNNLANIKHALVHGLSNARIESLNTRMQLLTRTAFGFHSAQSLIAMAFLKLGGLCPSLDRS